MTARAELALLQRESLQLTHLREIALRGYNAQPQGYPRTGIRIANGQRVNNTARRYRTGA